MVQGGGWVGAHTHTLVLARRGARGGGVCAIFHNRNKVTYSAVI